MAIKIAVLVSSICLALFGTVTRAIANAPTDFQIDEQPLNEWVFPQEDPSRGFSTRQDQTELFSQPYYQGTRRSVRPRVLAKGTEGNQVRGLQQRLQAHGFDSGKIDSVFGSRTETAVLAFQQAKGLDVTGLVDRDTWKALEADPQPVLPTQVLVKGDRGSKVRTLQTRLQTKGYDPGPVDGVYGRRTQTAVMAYQQTKGLEVNGNVNAETWIALSKEWSQE